MHIKKLPGKLIATAEETPAAAGNFPIIGIGASAGGLAAFEQFFSAMPFVTEQGMAFVLVQHLAPDHKSVLAELVSRYTRMQVNEITDGIEVRPGQIYIIPPNRDLVLMHGKLHLFEPDTTRGHRLTVDHFFRSLAADQKQRAICIVLSGTGSDGTLGVRAVKGEGGMVMAQTPSSTEFDGMPRSAIATGMVDHILPPAEMPERLLSYIGHSFGQSKNLAVTALLPPDIISKVCALIRAKTGRDFSGYKQSTIIRRMQRRMALQQVIHSADYVRYLQTSSDEVEALFSDLLIGVTCFFRDAAFGIFDTAGIPVMFKNVAENAPLRVWVCGCSTGEEAYSLAILLQEHMNRDGRRSKIQIFATDIDSFATNRGRTGVFPASIAADVSPERLARYFTREPGGSYRIAKSIRDLVIFSEHDVIQDPAFSRLNLISCRNLMIYLNGDVQKTLIGLFHYALKPGGLLFLGSSETVGDHSKLFDTLDRKAKIYMRKADSPATRRVLVAELAPPITSPRKAKSTIKFPEAPEPNFLQLSEQAVLKSFGLVGVLVNGHGEVLYYYGQTGAYLEPAPGNVSANIFTMARDGLRHELTLALQNAISKKARTSVSGIHFKAEGVDTCANVTVLPVEQKSTQERLFFVRLEPCLKPEVAAESVKAVQSTSRNAIKHITRLEHELRSKEEYIHTIIEEMATSSEELKSSNEELQAVNEEMQSTNEELETSKEELQSVNEELAAVNAELLEKVASLSRVNNDMNNLLAGTGVATLFLDQDLCITRFTPAVSHLVSLIPGDVGRPLADISSKLFGYDRMVQDARNVLDSLVTFETEAQTKNGSWYLMSIRPYKTLENMIQGVVVTFVDITEQRATQKKHQ